MPSPDQPQHAGPGAEDPESVYATFLTTDIRPLIRAAGPAALTAAHDAVAGHLRRYVTGKLSRPYDGPVDPPCLQPAFGLYCQAEKAAAATLILALSTTRHASRPAAPARLRGTLLGLADAIDALCRDASTAAATTATITPADLPGDVIGLGVAAAASLHFHAARDQAVHLLYHLWTCLDPGIGLGTIPGLPRTAPFPPPGTGTIPLN
jgi:hypothetical protein